MKVRTALALFGITLCTTACILLWPRARDAGAVLAAQDNPAALSDIQIASVLQNNPSVIDSNIEIALAAGDADLASSFVALAGAKNIFLSRELTARVDAAAAEQHSPSHVARRFVTGLVTGNADDAASLSGTVAGDLFVFGDIRDVVRESKHLVMGETADKLVLGLASAGLAVTAATYLSAGSAAPVRAGLTLAKDARKVGRLGEGLTEWVGRSTRGIIDTPVLENAAASGSAARPGQTVSQTVDAVKSAFRIGKADALMRFAKDVGRVGEKAGMRGAFDTLAIAEGPKDVARAARLAESKGGQTRAILKVLGRGALLLAAGAFNLSLWVFAGIAALFGALSSIKATTERLTHSWLLRRKARRLKQQLAAAHSASENPLAPLDLAGGAASS